jgi:4-amino-4-deoxy-L-arabinose transferase-like glycosyltransferase
MPGYPLFLTMMPSLRAAVAVQAIIGAALCVLVGSFVFLYWGASAGVIAELLLALDGPSIVQGSRILSDVLFQALLAIAVIVQLLVIARGRYDARSVVGGLGAALLLAVAIFVRPVGVLLPLIAPLPFLFMASQISWRRTIALCLAAFALPAMVVGGWMARNAARAGTWTLSTDVAIDLYYFKAGGVVTYRSGQTFPVVMDGLARELGLPSAGDYPDTPATLEPRMVSHSLRILLHDPVATFIVTARSLAWLALVPDRGSLNELLGTDAGATSYLAATAQLGERIRRLRRSPLLTALVTIQFVLIVVTWLGVERALLGLRGKPAREAALILIPFSIALLMMIMAAGAEAYARYRMPAAPFLAMLAGIGWSGGRFRNSRGEGGAAG